MGDWGSTLQRFDRNPTALYVLLIIAVIAAIALGFGSLVSATSNPMPIFTMKVQSAWTSVSEINFSSGQQWRENLSCGQCPAGAVRYNFSGMNFRYANGTAVNVSGCTLPIYTTVGPSAPFEGCIAAPRGAFIIYGYLNQT
ncbi:MAG: hypothetical protein KGH72_04280 [Candidatus Micrarchaeota archaeon]|nr:hypothetical protein [Candidatus Micrarchaeota archaeon]